MRIAGSGGGFERGVRGGAVSGRAINKEREDYRLPFLSGLHLIPHHHHTHICQNNEDANAMPNKMPVNFTKKTNRCNLLGNLATLSGPLSVKNTGKYGRSKVHLSKIQGKTCLFLLFP
jgi:hypothetical protein